MSGGRAWTIRRDSLELWQGLVLQNMGEVYFMFLGNIGNSLHHQIPPNWSSGLQIGFWISPKARGFWLNGLRRKSILKNDPNKNKKMRNEENINNSHFFIKWLPFLCLFIVFWCPFGAFGFLGTTGPFWLQGAPGQGYL